MAIKMPPWVSFGKTVHKEWGHRGAYCGRYKSGDMTTGRWTSVSCRECLQVREKNKYARQKRYAARKVDGCDDDV